MLDPWIIEQIRKREEEERHRRGPRPTIDLPYRSPRRREEHSDRDENPPSGDRGVVIIDL